MARWPLAAASLALLLVASASAGTSSNVPSIVALGCASSGRLSLRPGAVLSSRLRGGGSRKVEFKVSCARVPPLSCRLSTPVEIRLLVSEDARAALTIRRCGWGDVYMGIGGESDATLFEDAKAEGRIHLPHHIRHPSDAPAFTLCEIYHKSSETTLSCVVLWETEPLNDEYACAASASSHPRGFGWHNIASGSDLSSRAALTMPPP